METPILLNSFNATPAKNTCWLCVVCLSLSLFSFLPGFFAEFLFWDDHHLIFFNPFIQELSLENIKAIFNPFNEYHHQSPYWPFRDFLNLIVLYLFGKSALAFHALNLLLHSLAAFVLYLTVKRLSGSQAAAILSALIFFMHPQKVEPVIWISGLKETLSGFFSFLTIYLFVKWRDTEKAYKLIGSCLAFFLSVFSKWNTVVLIPVILSMDFFFTLGSQSSLHGHSRPHPLFQKFERLLFFTLGVIVVIAIFLFKNPADHDFQFIPSEIPRKLLLLPLLYIKLWLTPFNLNPLSEIDFDSLPPSFLISALLVELLLFFLAVHFYIKGKKWAPFLMIWWFLFLLPFLGFFKTTIDMADRYVYLASVAPSVLLGVFLSFLLEKRNIFLVLLCVTSLFFFWSVKTFSYSMDWSDSFRFWSMAIEKNKKSARCRFHRGLFLLKEEEVFSSVNRTGPFPQPQFKKHLGLIDMEAAIRLGLEGGIGKRQNEKIIAGAYREILEYHIQTRNLKACENIIRIVELQFSGNPELLNLAGIYYFENGEHEKALKALQKSVRISPRSIPARLNLSLALALNGDIRLAEEIAAETRLMVSLDKEMFSRLLKINKIIGGLKSRDAQSH